MTSPKTTYVSIPVGLATSAVQSNSDLKAYTVFYQLKSLYVGGIIKGYRTKLREIAQFFGYSERKIRLYIAKLTQKGLVEKANRNDLVLRGSKYLAKILNVSRKKFWRVPVERLTQLEDLFRIFAIEENIEQQQYRLEGKLLDSVLSARVGIQNPTNLQPSRYRQLRKAVVKDIDKLLLEQQTRYTDSVASLNSPSKVELFPFATLSRQGIAKVLNRKSKATGQKYARRFASLGLMSDTAKKVFVGDFSYEEYMLMQTTVLNHDYSYQYVKGEVHKVLPNLVRLNKNILA